MITLAVLLTVHNRKHKTLACLDRLFKQKLPVDTELEVYLTDDGCTDGTAEAIRERFPQVNIVQGDGTLYWNRGMLAAWEAAAKVKDYDFYLWLNDDTYLLDGAIHELLNEAAENPDSVIVGPTHSTGSDECLTYSGQKNNRHIKPDGTLQQCDTFEGNIVLISKAIYAVVGKLDRVYTHALGDLDYGWMVTHAGRKNYVSRKFRGICDRNPKPPIWMQPDIPFKRRLQNFYSPLAYGQPGPMFHYNKKNFGLYHALRVWITNHIRLFIPANK